MGNIALLAGETTVQDFSSNKVTARSICRRGLPFPISNSHYLPVRVRAHFQSEDAKRLTVFPDVLLSLAATTLNPIWALPLLHINQNYWFALPSKQPKPRPTATAPP